jgi:hypothetical protein
LKLYNRQDFLKLPSGTIFSSGEAWVITGFNVKGETIDDGHGNNIDFYYQDLLQIDSFNSQELFERLEEMLKDGKSYPINQHEGRDGLFDDEIRYLVYEKGDLEEIRMIFDRSLF